MHNNIKVSVLMPVYNEEKYLSDSIDSVLNQTYTDFEFIIVNDASTDRSESIISEKKDKRIKYFKNSQNLDIAKTLNIGLSHAKGDYIVRIDGNDFMDKTRIEKQVKFLDSSPNDLAAVGCNANIIIQETGCIQKDIYPTGKINCLFATLSGKNSIGHTMATYKRKMVLEVGGYRRERGEDFNLWLDLYKAGYYTDNIPEILTTYRYLSRGITCRLLDKQTTGIIESFIEFSINIIETPLNDSRIVNFLSLLRFNQPKSLEYIKESKSFFELLFNSFIKKYPHFIAENDKKSILHLFENRLDTILQKLSDYNEVKEATLLENMIKLQLDLWHQQFGAPSLLIYPFGKHTHWLLSIFNHHPFLKNIIGFADDNIKSTNCAPLKSYKETEIEYILLSSDSARNTLIKNIKKEFKHTNILNFYTDFKYNTPFTKFPINLLNLQ